MAKLILLIITLMVTSSSFSQYDANQLPDTYQSTDNPYYWKNKLPFEDLLIGFQLRIFREPNFYNTDFWHHFTNVYIDGAYFKFNEPCNSCEKLNQQIF